MRRQLCRVQAHRFLGHFSSNKFIFVWLPGISSCLPPSSSHILNTACPSRGFDYYFRTVGLCGLSQVCSCLLGRIAGDCCSHGGGCFLTSVSPCFLPSGCRIISCAFLPEKCNWKKLIVKGINWRVYQILYHHYCLWIQIDLWNPARFRVFTCLQICSVCVSVCHMNESVAVFGVQFNIHDT